MEFGRFDWLSKGGKEVADKMSLEECKPSLAGQRLKGVKVTQGTINLSVSLDSPANWIAFRSIGKIPVV